MQTKEKNKKIIFKVILLGVILIVLALLSKFAWAKYMTSLNGNSKADIAKWSFKVNKETNKSFTIDLSTTRGENQEAEVQGGYIGPGTSGEFIIEVDATDTEVSLEYNINMAVDYNDNTVFPKNLIFYSDPEMKNAIYHTENGITLNGFIAQSDDYKIIPHTIYWKWDFETGQTQTDKDKNDIADSYWIGQNISIPITVVGQQVNQNPNTNQYAVTFDANGGIIEGYGNSEKMTKSVNFNQEYGNLPIPTREGYEFKGWNGKNILNLDLYNMDTEYVKISDGKIIILKTDEDISVSTKYINLIDGKAYTITAKVDGEYTGRIYAFFGCSLFGGVNKNSFLYKADDDKGRLKIEQNRRIDTYDTNIYLVSDSVVISNIQLEEGAVATDYEPYFIKENTIVVQNSNHTLKAIWEKIDS